MKPRGIILVAIVLWAGFINCYAQDSLYIHRHTKLISVSFSPANLQYSGKTNQYLHLSYDYFLEKSASVNVDYYQFLSSGTTLPFKNYSSVFVGANYHIKSKNKFHFYFGAQPGIAIARRKINPENNLPGGNSQYEKTTVNALVAYNIGVLFHLYKNVHLYSELTYIQWQHLDDYAPVNLNEFRYNVGIGITF